MRRPLSKPAPAEADDGLDRTDWLDQNLDPTIPGPYECATGGLHIFHRTWTGATWLSPITGIPSKVRMPWRGVKPGSVPVEKYPSAVRGELLASLVALEAQVKPTPDEIMADAVGELAAAGFTEIH